MPQRYFTVDRSKRLTEDQTIHLIKYDDIEPPELQAHVDSLFPDGVTFHGESYILQGRRPAKGVSEVIELLFEYVRRSLFSSCPSRFQSVFAFDHVAQALDFRNQYGGSDSLIWEIECEARFKADMQLLTLQGSLLVLSYNAHRYWRGESSGNEPVWEYLLIPPVKVIRKIEP